MCSYFYFPVLQVFILFSTTLDIVENTENLWGKVPMFSEFVHLFGNKAYIKETKIEHIYVLNTLRSISVSKWENHQKLHSQEMFIWKARSGLMWKDQVRFG